MQNNNILFSNDYNKTGDDKQQTTGKKPLIQARLTDKRKEVERLTEVVSVYDKHKAMQLMDCGSYVEIDNVLKPNGELKQRIARANFCKLRICPMCAWRRSRRIYGDVTRATNYLRENENYRYMFLTLTLENVGRSEISNSIDKLLSSFSKLRKRKSWKDNIQGYFRALEVTYNSKRNDYHPHIHCILVVNKSYFDSRNYISKNEWIRLWKECLQVDYLPSVDIQAIKEVTHSTVSEVAKYTVKPIDFFQSDINKSVEVVQTIDQALKGVRLIQYGGVYAKAKKLLKIQSISNMNLNDGTIEIDENDILIKTVHSWNFGTKMYELKRN